MEFVSRSSFWSFNTELQFNGAEAALVFPYLNVLLLVLYSASVCSMNKSNQTCRTVAMQLPPPPWGTAEMRNLFTSSPQPHQWEEEPAGFPAENTAAAPAAAAAPSPWGGCLAGKEQTGPWKPTCPTQGLCCVSVSLSWGWGWVCQTVEQPQNCLMFSFYSTSALKSLLLDNSKKKNLPSVSSNVPNFNNFGVTEHKIFNLWQISFS